MQLTLNQGVPGSSPGGCTREPALIRAILGPFSLVKKNSVTEERDGEALALVADV